MLGTVEVWRGDDRLDVGTPRNREVLARLLLSPGRVLPIARLIDDLWEGCPPPQALSSLRTFICRLRRVVEPPAQEAGRPSVLITEPLGYVLRVDEAALDSARFEQLLQQARGAADPSTVLGLVDEALGLWRGPAYAEFTHALWAKGEVARLQELQLGAVERRLDTLLTLGRHGEAVPELEAHTRAHPLREEGWRLLALGLYRSSRQGDALAALRDARGYLAEELGVDPGPELRKLEAGILSQTADLDLPPAPAPVAIRRPVARLRCLGRDDLLATAGAAMADAESGSGSSMVFDGEPGVGRTQLLRGVEALADMRGFQVAWAQAHPLEREYDYGVARQVFEPILYSMPESERHELLRGTVQPAADIVWHNRPSSGGPDGLHALYRLAVRLAERAPLLIAIDDLQWCDPGSLRWLAYLARRIEGVPLVVAATRATGVPAGDDQLLESLCSLFAPVCLGGLPAEAAAALAAELFGAEPEPAFLASCLHETGGNTFLLAEHLKAQATGKRSTSIARWAAGQLRHAGPGAATLARAVATLDHAADFHTVADLAGLADSQAASALSALVGMGILRDGSPLRFTQPVVRQAVLDGVPASVPRFALTSIVTPEPPGSPVRSGVPGPVGG
ncbi:BTAD domain-containing putative transcriptional regulator [Nonomuraea sp. NPDC005983]|uniref:BTAD domain-containing putative transcriptional regulator n=1 Tax=Nonomuraea sp. NPDC005983 TaxID=3155595 RepID=UPI0033AE8134